jgi:DNA-binding transcriptional ArsR family regulator
VRFGSRPLFANSVDEPLYVDRIGEADRIVRAVQNSLTCLVLGDPGSGRTTLLYRVGALLGAAGYHVVIVPAYGTGETPAAVLAAAIQATITRFDIVVESQVFDPSDLFRQRPTNRALTVDAEQFPVALADFRNLLSHIPNTQLVVVLDELSAPSAYELFGRHRDELWELPVTWIVSGNVSQRQQYLTPPADAFFEIVVELGPLSSGQAVELLKKRLEGDLLPNGMLEEIARGGSTNPRELIARARDVLFESDDAGIRLRELADLDHQISQLGRSASMLAAELSALGPVVASDKRLLERLGWTRSRVVQVLRQLEDAGFVSSREEPRSRGRPVKVYSLKRRSE